MPTVAGCRKCRVQGCQRKPFFVDPSVDNMTGEATHCAAHREEGFPLQEGFSLNDGFLLQNGVVVHNTYRGSTAYRTRVANSSGDGGDNVPATTSHAGKQARGGKGRSGGVGKGRGGSVAHRTSRSSTCQFPDCAKPATHGDGSTPTRCAAHKEKGQIDHKHRLCENMFPKPCLKQPSFGWPGESRKRFCGAHRRPGTVDLRNCEHEGCGTRASHGFGKGRARFCAAHSLPGTSVVANKPCEKEGCIVSPRFGYEGGKPRFCASHKEKQMVNLKDRRCERHPCTTQPTFALPGEKPRFCSKHKSEGHVNVRHKLCRHPNCKLVPTYGTEGTRVPVACLEHSDGDMVDLKRARMRMSKAKKATAVSAAASSPSSHVETAARAAAETAPASPAVAGRVGAGTGTVPAAPEEAVAVSAAMTGKKRPRAKATPSLGGNAGIGRKIAEAIFTSSQRVLEGEEAAAAATEESEWEEDELGEADSSGEGHGDEDEEEDAVEEVGQEGARGQSLSTSAAVSAEIASEASALVSPIFPGVTSPSQPLPEGTSLVWSCVVCSKPIGAGDRHVLMCCGYGLLHRACTTTFVHSQTPCPKCSRLVNSFMQVFV